MVGLTIAVPAAYPYVMLSATVAPFVASTLMSGSVMKARKTYNVPYPNLYAVPGVHEHADNFNRVQRGHQNMFETLASMIAMTLVGGLKFPKAAILLVLAYCVGNVFYLKGYADTSKDVKMARYSGPVAALKPIGILGSFFNCLAACVVMIR